YGSTHIRSHCNVDPVVGLRNLEATLQAVEGYREKAFVEIVAFPQHGLLLSQSVSLVRDALRNGAALVGGLDPTTVDENMEKSLNTVMELAVEANAGIDLHLHESSHVGLNTFKRVADLT
ncbi:deaminase, partial [Clostridium perfringens]